jgi:hypothetical protein
VIAAVVWVGGDITLTTLGIVFERIFRFDTVLLILIVLNMAAKPSF